MTTYDASHDAFWHDLNGIRYNGQAAPSGWYRIKVLPENYAAVINMMGRPDVASFRIRGGYASGSSVFTFQMS